MKRNGRIALGGVVAVVLLLVFFQGVQWEALLAAFRAARPLDLLLVVAVTIVTYLLRAWRWGYLLAPITPVRFDRLFSATVVGFMTGLFIPRAGEVVRPYLIGRRHGVATSAAFASIILERLVDLITVIVLFGLYLYVLPHPAEQSRGALFQALRWGGALAGLGALVVLAVLLAFHHYSEAALVHAEGLLRWLPERLAHAVAQGLRSFGGGLAVLRAPLGHLLAIAGQSALVWLSIAAGIHANNRAFGLDLPFHSAFLIIGFLTVGVAVPTPGMVGGFHESYRLALTQAFGVATGPAVAAGIALHALTNLPVLVLGLVLLGREGLTFGKVAAVAEETRNHAAPTVGVAGEGTAR
jgi:hypothetical protein